MADNPALNGEKQEEERKRAGFFFWLSKTLSSRYVLVAAITGGLTISAIGIKDIFQRSNVPSGTGAQAASGASQSGAGPAGDAGSEAPDPAVGASQTAAQGAAGAGSAGAPGGAGSEQAAVEALLSVARKQAAAQKGQEPDGSSAPAAKTPDSRASAGTSAASASGAQSAGSGGPASKRPAVQGKAVQDPNMIKAFTRSWQNRAPARNSPLKIGQMAALDRLKGIESTLTASKGRKVESEGSLHKKEWDAAAHTDVAMTSRGNAQYNSKIREEIAAKPNDGGPVQAGPVADGQEAQPAPVNFPEDKSRQQRTQNLMDAAALLLPVASFMLLGSYRPDEGQATALSKLSAYGGLGASALTGISGAGILMDGQPLTGGAILAVSALLANASARNT